MTGFQAAWPCFPLAGALPADRPRPRARGVWAGPSSFQCGDRNVKFKSLLDLVEAHGCLALTDPRLMSWYLCLSPEDRQIILDEGGFQRFLQRHPALELSGFHVYLKYRFGNTGPVLPTLTSNKLKPPRAKTYRCELPLTHLALEALPGDVTQLCCSSRDGSQKPPQDKVSSSDQGLHLQDITQELSPLKAHMDRQSGEKPPQPKGISSISRAAMSEDPAVLASFSLDMDMELEQWGTSALRSPRADFTHDEVGLLQETIGNKSEFYSFVSTEMEGDESHRSLGPVNSPRAPADKRSTAEGRQSHMVCGNESMVDNNEASLSLDEESDAFHSIMEDKGVSICPAGDELKRLDHGVHSGPDSSDGDAPTSTRETTTTSTLGNDDDAPLSCVATCEVTISTGPTPSTFTQSEDPETADKNIITEVHMADLDYLAGEFIKLKMTQEKLTESAAAKAAKATEECDCARRAQQAELSLLALQYSSCLQHCWTLHHTSSEGGQLGALRGHGDQYGPQHLPPANISRVLQKLESDYNEMRHQILEGVPLGQLQPLCVDSEKITAGARYVPAQIVVDVLESLSLWPENQDMKETSKARRAVPQDRGAAYKELNTGEAWYDAEEHLEPAGPTVAVETRRDVMKGRASGSSTEEARSSVLCVSNLPGAVTESDVMLWFQKHCPSEAHICVLKNDWRVAMVMVSGPQRAEAAVRELNGFSVRGHTLHVEHISGGVGRSQDAAAADPPQSRAGPGSAEGKLVCLSSSITQRTAVSVCPAARATCVPQHYGTMGSFDALMAELTRLHPDVGRQRIVEALMELRARHRGVLRGLPLRVIRDMTSQLLAGPDAAL